MKRLFATLSAILAVTPGLTIILLGIGVPPQSKGLLGGITEAIGGIVLLIVYVNRKRIVRLSKSKLNRAVGMLILISICSVGLYILLLKHCVIIHPTHHSIYFPIVTTGRMAQIIDSVGSRYRALDIYGHHSISTEMLSMPAYGFLISLTTLLFVLLQQGIANTLVAAFALLATYEHMPLVADPSRRKKSHGRVRKTNP